MLTLIKLIKRNESGEHAGMEFKAPATLIWNTNIGKENIKLIILPPQQGH